MTLLEGLSIWVIEVVLIAALASHRKRARFGVLTAAFMLPDPWFVGAPPIQRGMIVFVFEICFVRAVQMALKPLTGGFIARLIYVFSFVAFLDTRDASETPRRVDWQAAKTMVFAAIIGLAAVVSWRSTEDLLLWLRYPVRIAVGIVLIFAAVEITASVTRVLTVLGGVTVPPLHDSPYRSGSLSDFWGKRWNLGAANALRVLCFAPLAHRSLTLALFATFAASAVLHGYIALVALGLQAALMWMTFFLLQPLLIMLERQIRIKRLPRFVRYSWVILMLALSSPLLIAPFLQFFKIKP